MNRDFQIIVIGAGHAGCEAALAAARMGMSTALITMDRSAVAKMSCNPAIGGIAKSHIVCELDSLGGEIGRNADYSGIQFRTLNTKKGAAVQAHRIQCDKSSYSSRMKSVLDNTKNLNIIENTVNFLETREGSVVGVKLADGAVVSGWAVIIAPGTFLGGTIHIGKKTFQGGRHGEPSANALGEYLRKTGFNVSRFKTGTPPRLHRDSLDYARMTIQPGLLPAPFFSWVAAYDRMFHVEQKDRIPDKLTELFHVEQMTPEIRSGTPGFNQVPCYLTHTTSATHQIVSENLSASALYGGVITATGVRYCPSIEDKVVRFSQRQSHHVFVEPEGRDDISVYPNGISNSLPEDVQVRLVRSIPGMERAEFLEWGYGIEHDYCDPLQLKHTMETKAVRNLYFAGQMNGTTGYEEAAAQGFVAGVNAVRKIRGEPDFIPGRADAYTGVLIDDLVTKGVDEPYRMFTSRAEYRLLLRQDNAPLRMLSFARDIGIVPQKRLNYLEAAREAIQEEIKRLRRIYVSESSLAQILMRPEFSYERLPGAREELDEFVRRQVEFSVKYEGYITRELQHIRRIADMDAQRIPGEIDYGSIKALRFEARQKLEAVRPVTLGQASRIPGVNPADIAALSVLIKTL